MGRGRFLQLLSLSLSSCRLYHPAGATCLISQSATHRTAFTLSQRARPPESNLTRLPLSSLTLRPDDSLTILKMALSVRFIRFVSSTDGTLATGF